MSDTRYLDWPFDDRHRDLARRLDDWSTTNIAEAHGRDVDDACRALVRSLGGAGWLQHAVAAQARCIPHLGRGRGAGLRPPRARRGDGPRHPAPCSAACWPTSSRRSPSSPRWPP